MITGRGFEKIKEIHENESFAKKFNFSNGHVYAFIKIWELTSSTFFDYKNFGNIESGWKQKKIQKFSKTQLFQFFKKYKLFYTSCLPQSWNRVKRATNNQVPLISKKEHKTCLFLVSEKDMRNIPESSRNIILKLKFALIECVFWCTIFIFAQ